MHPGAWDVVGRDSDTKLLGIEAEGTEWRGSDTEKVDIEEVEVNEDNIIGHKI